MARVLVVGAGVVGLSCAVRLLERGHDVSLVARDLPLETTSAVAAALWYPYRAQPVERVAAWAGRTYAELARLASAEHGEPGGANGTGVVLREGTEVLRRSGAVPALPWWAGSVPGLELSEPTGDVPRGYVSGWRFRAPVIEMPVYLRWLLARVDALGGLITRMALSGLPDRAEVVVNATGLGGRLIAQDRTLLPVRGQVLYVEQVGLDRWWLDSGTHEEPAGDPAGEPSTDDGPTYVVPRSRDVVVGGTGVEGSWHHTPDPEIAERILARAVALVPELARARVLGHRVGLHPARPTVRLEAVTGASGRQVVHCYGHGAAGVTLSWGCADEVAALVGDPVVRGT